jgi:hypothetical protein
MYPTVLFLQNIIHRTGLTQKVQCHKFLFRLSFLLAKCFSLMSPCVKSFNDVQQRFAYNGNIVTVCPVLYVAPKRITYLRMTKNQNVDYSKCKCWYWNQFCVGTDCYLNTLNYVSFDLRSPTKWFLCSLYIY